jgi:hypothetical protein
VSKKDTGRIGSSQKVSKAQIERFPGDALLIRVLLHTLVEQASRSQDLFGFQNTSRKSDGRINKEKTICLFLHNCEVSVYLFSPRMGSAHFSTVTNFRKILPQEKHLPLRICEVRLFEGRKKPKASV